MTSNTIIRPSSLPLNGCIFLYILFAYSGVFLPSFTLACSAGGIILAGPWLHDLKTMTTITSQLYKGTNVRNKSAITFCNSTVDTKENKDQVFFHATLAQKEPCTSHWNETNVTIHLPSGRVFVANPKEDDVLQQNEKAASAATTPPGWTELNPPTNNFLVPITDPMLMTAWKGRGRRMSRAGNRSPFRELYGRNGDYVVSMVNFPKVTLSLVHRHAHDDNEDYDENQQAEDESMALDRPILPLCSFAVINPDTEEPVYQNPLRNYEKYPIPTLFFVTNDRRAFLLYEVEDEDLGGTVDGVAVAMISNLPARHEVLMANGKKEFTMTNDTTDDHSCVVGTESSSSSTTATATTAKDVTSIDFSWIRKPATMGGGAVKLPYLPPTLVAIYPALQLLVLQSHGADCVGAVYLSWDDQRVRGIYSTSDIPPLLTDDGGYRISSSHKSSSSSGLTGYYSIVDSLVIRTTSTQETIPVQGDDGATGTSCHSGIITKETAGTNGGGRSPATMSFMVLRQEQQQQQQSQRAPRANDATNTDIETCRYVYSNDEVMDIPVHRVNHFYLEERSLSTGHVLAEYELNSDDIAIIAAGVDHCNHCHHDDPNTSIRQG